MLPHELLDLSPEDLSLAAMCAEFGIADGMKRLAQLNSRGVMASPTFDVMG